MRFFNPLLPDKYRPPKRQHKPDMALQWLRNRRKLQKLRKKQARRAKPRQTRKHCTVYGLYDGSGVLQYIGQTRMIDLNRRLKAYRVAVEECHKRGRTKLVPVLAWVSDCDYRGDPVVIKAIDNNATWNVSEIIYIDRARQSGIKLLNILRGGTDTIHDLRRERQSQIYISVDDYHLKMKT